jgi:thiazole tautomerase (transcriptional regulator TenI)
VHSMREIRLACQEGADYILVGHIFPTASKEGLGQPLGLQFLRTACSGVSTPILGLGGMRPEFVPSVLAAGAAGVAGISLFQNTSDFRKLIKDYLCSR